LEIAIGTTKSTQISIFGLLLGVVSVAQNFSSVASRCRSKPRKQTGGETDHKGPTAKGSIPGRSRRHLGGSERYPGSIKGLVGSGRGWWSLVGSGRFCQPIQIGSEAGCPPESPPDPDTNRNQHDLGARNLNLRSDWWASRLGFCILVPLGASRSLYAGENFGSVASRRCSKTRKHTGSRTA
jgi:hypothetical protein